MAATREDLSRWFDDGVKRGATHMIVVCDTYDFEDYPDYVMPGEDVRAKERHYTHGGNMQSVMEVYKLDMSKADQMAEHRAFHY